MFVNFLFLVFCCFVFIFYSVKSKNTDNRSKIVIFYEYILNFYTYETLGD